MVSPVLTQGYTNVTAYFPKDVYYDYFTGALMPPGNNLLQAPLTFVPLHIRGGFVVPTQQPSLTTTASRLNPFALFVALDSNGQAQGSLYLDDGESLDSINSTIYGLVSYSVANGKLSSTVMESGYTYGRFTNITVYGLTSVSGVIVNGVSYSSYTFINQVLLLTGLTLNTISAWTVGWK